MIYFVTLNQELFRNDAYEAISVERSLELLEPLKVVGLDTETKGLDPYTKELLSIQLGNRDFQVVIDCTTISPLAYKEYLESDGRTFLGWNLKFDLKFLYRQGIYPRRVYDGFLAEKLLWLGYPGGMHSMSLKSAGEHYLGIELDKSVRGKIINVGLQTDVIVYAAEDVAHLEDIILRQWEELKAKGLCKAIRVENQFVLSLAYCEYCGIKLDEAKWRAKMKKDQEALDKATKQLNAWVVEHFPDDGRFTEVNLQGDLWTGFDTSPHCTINWASPRQVAPFFEELGFDLNQKSRETGSMVKSVDAKVIEPQKDKSPVAEIYLKYKAAAKIVGTYGENFLEQINPVSHRIHTSYQQCGADTTRITSGGKDRGANVEYVNLLNLPSDEETRACFVAEEGNSWISIDYTGQETYLMASIANDRAIIKELTEGSGDIHSLTAYMAYKEIPRDTSIKDIKKRYHKLRQEAKGIEFAINYGGDANTIHQNKGIPMEEAQQIYDSYMSGFTGLRDYQKFRRRDWWDKGYILLNPITGHKAFIYDYRELRDLQESFKVPGFWDHYRQMKKEDPSCDTVQRVRHFFKRKSDTERKSINFPIQATGSMCLRHSMISFFEWLRQNGLFGKVLICVTPYDEINCEAPKEIAMDVARQLHKCMVDAGAIFCTRCKLDAEVSYDKDGSLPDHWVH